MGCRICGDDRTVRSHIIPQAFARDVRKGAKHVAAGFPKHPGIRYMQAGAFSDDLLCGTHESLTSAVDTYAVEFVRRVQSMWPDRRATATLLVPNPKPNLLRKFVLLTIWREVHFEAQPGVTLGNYELPVRRHLFEGQPSPDWAIVVQRTNFTVAQHGVSDFNLHPYRYRVLDRSAWTFTVAGVSFIAFSDQRGLPPPFDEWRADKHDPCRVSVPDPSPLAEVGALQGAFRLMRLRGVRSR